MPTVLNSEAEYFNTKVGRASLHKVMDSSPLTHKVAKRGQAVIQGQGRFAKRWLPLAIPPVV